VEVVGCHWSIKISWEWELVSLGLAARWRSSAGALNFAPCTGFFTMIRLIMHVYAERRRGRDENPSNPSVREAQFRQQSLVYGYVLCSDRLEENEKDRKLSD
jgi:hypothetical protein